MEVEELKKGAADTYLKNREMAKRFLKQADDLVGIDPFEVIDLRGRAIGLMEAKQNLAECLWSHGFSIDVYMQATLD